LSTTTVFFDTTLPLLLERWRRARLSGGRLSTIGGCCSLRQPGVVEPLGSRTGGLDRHRHRGVARRKASRADTAKRCSVGQLGAGAAKRRLTSRVIATRPRQQVRSGFRSARS